jgi:transcription initiation factor IIF auxiliary subunit
LNGKSYIGSSVNLSRRLSCYFSLAPSGHERHKERGIIYKALLKHGYSNFQLEILEYCERDKVRAREQYYLDHLEHEYNILPIAGSSLGQNHSEETKAKISEAARETWKEPARREAVLTAFAVANKARSHAVEVTNIETGGTVSYVSQSQAAKELGEARSTFRDYMKSGKPLKGI